jgi:hypothetical protein
MDVNPKQEQTSVLEPVTHGVLIFNPANQVRLLVKTASLLSRLKSDSTTEQAGETSP